MSRVALLFLVTFCPFTILNGQEKVSSPKTNPQDTGSQDLKSTNLTTLSILPFKPGEQVEEQLGEKIAEEIEVPLIKSGRFRILTRSKMTLEEMNRLVELQASQGRVDERASFQRLSCEKVFVNGSVRRYGEAGYNVYLKLVSLSSGELLLALDMRCWHQNGLSRIARAFTREILSRVDINGTVVKTSGKNIFVKIKSGPDGVKSGDLLSVSHPVKTIKSGGEIIDPGENPPFGTLKVCEITTSGHLRCEYEKEKGESPAKVVEGDFVRLISICPKEKQAEKNVVVLPFELSETSGSDSKLQDNFPFLVQQEMIFGASRLHGMKVINPEGLERYSSGNEDGRVICDDLGVDGVLRGRFVKFGNELRLYARLVLHPQVDVYIANSGIRNESITKRIIIPLKDGANLSAEDACKVAEQTIKAFQEKKK